MATNGDPSPQYLAWKVTVQTVKALTDLFRSQ